MFLIAAGLSLPILLGGPSPGTVAILLIFSAIGLIADILRKPVQETDETLSTPARILGLLLLGGGVIALLKTWPEPIRKNALLLVFSGAFLFWGYRHDRFRNPWFFAGPCLFMALVILVADFFGWMAARWYIGPAWLLATVCLPGALAWGLITERRKWAVGAFWIVGLLYSLLLFVLADWMGLLALAVVLVAALVARQLYSDGPFIPSGLALTIWLGISAMALLPGILVHAGISSVLRTTSVAALLKSQSIAERIVGPETWGWLWSIPRRLPRTALTGMEPWWKEYADQRVADHGWLIGLLIVAVLFVVFLVSTPTQCPQDRSHPRIWRILILIGWLVVGFPTSFWLVSPLGWLLMGGILGLKEGTEEDKRGWISDSGTYFTTTSLVPALMTALMVVPIIQSAREWRAERILATQANLVRAAQWAPWRADIVKKALEEQLKRPAEERDSVTVEHLTGWLDRSGETGAAYRAEASLQIPGERPTPASLAAAVQTSPHDPDIRRRYADTLKTSGELEKAREQYEACANLAPFDPSLRIAIGSIWELLHREELALPEYEKALKLDPLSEVARIKVMELSSRVSR